MKMQSGTSSKGTMRGNRPPLIRKATASGIATPESCNPTPVRMAKFRTAMLKACVMAPHAVSVRRNGSSETANAVRVRRPMVSR